MKSRFPVSEMEIIVVRLHRDICLSPPAPCTSDQREARTHRNGALWPQPDPSCDLLFSTWALASGLSPHHKCELQANQRVPSWHDPLLMVAETSAHGFFLAMVVTGYCPDSFGCVVSQSVPSFSLSTYRNSLHSSQNWTCLTPALACSCPPQSQISCSSTCLSLGMAESGVALASGSFGTDSEASLCHTFLWAACAGWGCMGDHSYQITDLHWANSSQSPMAVAKASWASPRAEPLPCPPSSARQHTHSSPQRCWSLRTSPYQLCSWSLPISLRPPLHTVHHKGALVCAPRAASGCFLVTTLGVQAEVGRFALQSHFALPRASQRLPGFLSRVCQDFGPRISPYLMRKESVYSQPSPPGQRFKPRPHKGLESKKCVWSSQPWVPRTALPSSKQKLAL